MKIYQTMGANSYCCCCCWCYCFSLAFARPAIFMLSNTVVTFHLTTMGMRRGTPSTTQNKGTARRGTNNIGSKIPKTTPTRTPTISPTLSLPFASVCGVCTVRQPNDALTMEPTQQNVDDGGRPRRGFEEGWMANDGAMERECY